MLFLVKQVNQQQVKPGFKLSNSNVFTNMYVKQLFVVIVIDANKLSITESYTVICIVLYWVLDLLVFPKITIKLC